MFYKIEESLKNADSLEILKLQKKEWKPENFPCQFCSLYGQNVRFIWKTDERATDFQNVMFIWKNKGRAKDFDVIYNSRL